MMLYLLDTNTCIAAMRHHAATMKRMAAVAPHDCAISTVTGYELYTGVEKCADPARERVKVDLVLNSLQELSFDANAAREAARVRAILEAAGCPIGPYDTLLAGHALALSLTMVTANTAEFARVPGLRIENWQV